MITKKTSLVLKTVLLSVAVFAVSTPGSLTLFGQTYNLGTVINKTDNVNVSNTANGADISIGSIGGNNKGYINWNDFNIPFGQTGNFNFSGNNGVILNHVTGNNPTNTTAINGMLTSNGNVYVINPNGLTIGNTGVINAKGFVGTTYDLTPDTLNRINAGNYENLDFIPGSANIENYGTINIRDVSFAPDGTPTIGGPVAGDIVLMGYKVINENTLESPQGHIILFAGAGETVHNNPGHPMITVNGDLSRLVTTGGNIYGMAINNTGTIRANYIEITTTGQVLLKGNLFAEKSSDGKAGTVNVNSRHRDIDIENATISALGGQSSDNGNGIKITTIGNININSSVIATEDANVNIEATNGDIHFGIDQHAPGDRSNTLVNAYGTGNVNVKAQDITLDANKANAYISVGSNHGTTTVTTARDLTIKASNGGYAQVGYHFRADDDRIFNWDENENSLFSGFTDTSPNSEAMQRLRGLMIPTGDINVIVARDLIIQASYKVPTAPDYAPAAHIGHAFLASDTNIGKAITPYTVENIGGINFPMPGAMSRLSGNINVTVGQDAKIFSEGASIARVGHNVRNFVHLSSSDGTMQVNEVRGNVILKAIQDIYITAKDGGTSGVGHVGDEFHQGSSLSETNPAYFCSDIYQTTAGGDTILKASGFRTLADGENWHSIAQIGSNIMGKAAVSNDNVERTLGGSINANVIALSGANMSLKGEEGGTSAIGHENNSRLKYFDSNDRTDARDKYQGTIIVGYSFNRYQELDDKGRLLAMNDAMLDYYNNLKDEYFSGKDEGYLKVDGNSRIGWEYDIPSNSQNETWRTVGIFGFRMMRDGKTDAIRLDDGAQIGTGKIDNNPNRRPGQYDFDPDGSESNFLYQLGRPYPGDDASSEYDPIEYYGRGRDNGLFDFWAFSSSTGEKQSAQTTRIFYPIVSKETPPPPPPPPHEKPRYPWIPVWFAPCCQPCCAPCCDPCYNPCGNSCFHPCRVDCCEPCANPCRSVRTTCESYLPVDSAEENGGLPVPTLAPPKSEDMYLELPTP